MFFKRIALAALVGSCITPAMAPASSWGGEQDNTIRVQLVPEQVSNVRCFHFKNISANDPETTWVWGETPDRKRFEIVGRWATSAKVDDNIFYTDTRTSELHAMCQDTLNRKANYAELQGIAAADGNFSSNFRIWTNDRFGGRTGIDRLIVLGDSYSDTGNTYSASRMSVPNAKRWSLGRFSNGANWIDRVAADTGLSVVNFAYGNVPGTANVKIPDLQAQARAWIAARDRAAMPNKSRNMVVIMSGVDDLVYRSATVVDALANVRKAVDLLVADEGMGALLLVNLPDLARTPMFNKSFAGPAMADKVREFNKGIAEIYASIPTDSWYSKGFVDTHAIIGDILSNPLQYSMVDAKQGCVDTSSNPKFSFASSPGVRFSCVNSDLMAFWDDLHPTRKLHGAWGKAAANYIKKNVEIYQHPAP